MAFLRRTSRADIAFVHDVVMAALSLLVALYLRVGDDIWRFGDWLLYGPAVFAAIGAVTFRTTGLYRGVWRYASVRDLVAITRAATLTILIFLPLMFMATRLEAIPRSLPLINWFVLMALLGGPRFLYRIVKDRRSLRLSLHNGGRAVPVLLIGAGDEAELFIRSLERDRDAPYRPVGMVAHRQARVGRNIHGVAVLGRIDEIGEVLDTLSQRGEKPQRLLIASHELSGAEVRGLLDIADAQGLTLAKLPRLTDFQDLGSSIEIRPVAVEDLLGRPQAVLDREGIAALIEGRRVLVTGAGGSIGGELVRQIAALGPAHLTLLDLSEYALYTIDMEMQERFPAVPRAAVIANVRDVSRMAEAMAAARPHLVFHAAALKHVPLVEANPVEGVLTNAVGSRIVADACVAHGVQAMVLISTDKAVNPTNVMGATKRIAESYCQSLDLLRLGTRFITVRFGNVLGSTGSVVPLFQRQLAAGGPLTVTHPDVVRYFMTIREAVELVLQASALGTRNRDEGKIYVLDMGEPVRIVDLARQMIRLAGLRPDGDVKIDFTGLRPGEKLFEEIFHGAEPPVPTERDGILLASPRAVEHAIMSAAVEALREACEQRRTADVIEAVKRLVPEFGPTRAAEQATA